jgi:hypothetical protein
MIGAWPYKHLGPFWDCLLEYQLGVPVWGRFWEGALGTFWDVGCFLGPSWATFVLPVISHVFAQLTRYLSLDPKTHVQLHSSTEGERRLLAITYQFGRLRPN